MKWVAEQRIFRFYIKKHTAEQNTAECASLQHTEMKILQLHLLLNIQKVKTNHCLWEHKIDPTTVASIITKDK